MKTVLTFLGLTFCLFTLAAKASEPMPKPGPEMKKFEMFTGKWKLEEADAASPFSLAGKATFDTETRFVHDGFVVEEHGKGKLNGQPNTYTIVYYFDPAAGTYHSFYYDNTGVAIHADGTLTGNSWMAHWTQELKGKQYKGKGEAVLAPDGKKFTYEWTYSEDGVTWKPMFKGTATKVSK